MANDQDKRVKQLKRELEGWREVILPLNSVLMWEKNWYPGMLVGVTTAFFLLLWYMDPSVLTTVSIMGLIAALVDYLVPTLTANICNPENWTGSKERKLEDICRGLAGTQIQIINRWRMFYDMRYSRPTVYYVTVVCCLISLAWLGSVINNLLLTYLAVTTAVLLPGMKHHGLLHKYFARFMITISEMIKGIKQKKN
ncbi:hypothetical protein L9F63_010721 [Diploptera punctata]|uniref:RETREG1-3/ARL6IP-like N-terminal reticulon-homology domain-containing protein n=1 Tax=Diploptera punctata TaxID=6984 RepID=A0AAD8AI34_DIPPU|nr:hypothetical protein L9F63_010721 [Diploptera punctata]